jgi:predicted HTH transcriptional regulator
MGYGYVEARGMGIRTKVIPLMKQHNETEPVFEATEDFLKTDLFRLKGHRDPLNDPLNKIQVQLLNALKTKPKADYTTLAKILDVSPATVKRNIQKLKEMGVLKRIGSKKTGYWEVTD